MDFGDRFGEILKQSSKVIVMPMDLKIVKDKSANHEYASTNDFLIDIKWIVHAAKILYGKCMGFPFNGRRLQIISAVDFFTLLI